MCMSTSSSLFFLSFFQFILVLDDLSCKCLLTK